MFWRRGTFCQVQGLVSLFRRMYHAICPAKWSRASVDEDRVYLYKFWRQVSSKGKPRWNVRQEESEKVPARRWTRRGVACQVLRHQTAERIDHARQLAEFCSDCLQLMQDQIHKRATPMWQMKLKPYRLNHRVQYSNWPVLIGEQATEPKHPPPGWTPGLKAYRFRDLLQ